MRKHLLIFFISLNVFCLMLGSESRAASEGILLNTKHSVYGIGKVYVCPVGIKVVNEGGGRTVIVKAPDWKVAVFDDDTKLFWVGTLADYAHGDFVNVLNVVYAQEKVVPVKTSLHSTMAGMKATKYVTIADKALPKSASNEVAYWVAEDTGIPPAVCKAFCIMSGLPQLPGITLRASYPPRPGMKVNNIDTTSSAKMKFADDFFKYPSGFEKAASLRQLLFNPESIKDFVSP
jgi:hypothetical protein